MRGICYLCCGELELTDEHIIPQCLGGVLREPLYCETCNTQCGHNVDVELAAQFGRFATLLLISRQRGINQPFTIVVDDDSGIKMRCDGLTIKRSKPVVRIETSNSGVLTEAEVIARSEEELKEIFGRIAARYNIDPSLCQIEQLENPAPVAYHEFAIDNVLIRRAVAKICYGFACLRIPSTIVMGGEFDPIRRFILGFDEYPLACANYAHGDFMVDNHRPLHKIHIRLERENRILVGYIALFGAFRFSVLLAENLSSEIVWPGIDYTYNPVSQRTVEGRDIYIAPSIGRENVLRPKHTREGVLRALIQGQVVIADHSQMVEAVHVEEVKGINT